MAVKDFTQSGSKGPTVPRFTEVKQAMPMKAPFKGSSGTYPQKMNITKYRPMISKGR